jgi:preprotein translocase subunit SecF
MSPDRILPGSAGTPDEPVKAATPEQPEERAGDGTEEDTELEEVFGALGTSPDEAPSPSREEKEPQGKGDRSASSPQESTERESSRSVEQEGNGSDDHGPTTQRRAKRTHWFSRIYYGETRFDFVRRKRIWFIFSSLIILAGVGSLATRGLNLGIDFVGGTSWSVPTKQVLTTNQVQTVLGSLITGETITFLGDKATNSETLNVEAKLPKGQSLATSERIESSVAVALSKLTHHSLTNGVADAVSIQSVGPSWGGQITHKAIVALIVFFILIAIYISIFFEWRMAFAAIVAVLHDVLVTVGVYSLTGLEVTPDTVVAILTILGYSLYDTIVVFDRVRDNVKNLTVRDRLTYSDIVNVSMNQTLARSINTSAVAIMPILAVLVLGADVLGATTLQYFGLALLVGLTTGAYSSIFIASPLVALIKEHEPKYRIIRERLELRGSSHVLLSAAAVAAGTFDLADAPAINRSARKEQRVQSASGAITPSHVATSAPTYEGVPTRQPGSPVGSSSQRQGARPRPNGPSRPPSRSRRKGRRR